MVFSYILYFKKHSSWQDGAVGRELLFLPEVLFLAPTLGNSQLPNSSSTRTNGLLACGAHALMRTYTTIPIYTRLKNKSWGEKVHKGLELEIWHIRNLSSMPGTPQVQGEVFLPQVGL